MPKKETTPSIQQTAIGDGNVQIVGDQNVVNQTIIQKFINIFSSDPETAEQRNRRIMLDHVENFWVKGILEKSLHGAALLELGIKENPDMLTYPWTIKREATKETLPAGMSMLQIFQGISMGRSLLILGAPGSGKTTMLLELARQLIKRAREDVTEPIPVVFNLSSWTEKFTLSEWLAIELNTIYYVPLKVAPVWVKENKMLLLLDGLDEIGQENRHRCVEAINQFRKENGLTNLAVCTRIQEYAELKTRLVFDGAIEIQPLTPDQIREYFKRFGQNLEGIQQVFEQDPVLREMAETPLFLSIMTLAYRNIAHHDIFVSENFEVQRKHLFETYIERMFQRPERSKNNRFSKQDVLHWLPWLAHKMIKYNQVPFEIIQPGWLEQSKQLSQYRLIVGLIVGLFVGLPSGVLSGLAVTEAVGLNSGLIIGPFVGLIVGLIYGFIVGTSDKIETVYTVTWNSRRVPKGLLIGLVVGLSSGLLSGLIGGLIIGLIVGLFAGLFFGLNAIGATKRGRPRSATESSKLELGILTEEGLQLSAKISPFFEQNKGLDGLIENITFDVIFGVGTIIQHIALRFVLAENKLLPWKVIPFLDTCADLIFLRRVGSGYIFVHRLLMEHFAAMYTENIE